MTKNEIADVLTEIGTLLELKGENPFKVRAYQTGAKSLESIEEAELARLVQEEELQTVKGIGEALARKITELKTTGKLEFYEELKASIPPGLVEMLEIPGMGPKKIQAASQKLGVNSIDELQKACENGKVAELEGFGAKSQEKILSGIKNRLAYSKRHLWWDAWTVSEPILEGLRKLPQVNRAESAGSLRRGMETVGDLDFLVAADDVKPVVAWFTHLPNVAEVTAEGETKASVRFVSGLQADLRIVADEQFPFALHHFTGSKEHNVQMRQRALARGLSLSEWGLVPSEGEGTVKQKTEWKRNAKVKTEEEIFRELGLHYIPPELREGMGEIEVAENGEFARMVEYSDLKGVFHNHTIASDGRNTLAEMAEEAERLGWEYLGIADHSKSSFQANGLSEERLLGQIEEIHALNKSKRFKTWIFAGSEVDILPDGTLDYDDSVLAKLDYVVASVHSVFSLSEKEMTARVIRAIENPHVTMIGHLTGRLLLRRSPYQIDVNAVFEAAAAKRVVLELNASPQRIDLDWRYWRRLLRDDTVTSINPDAHTAVDLRFARAGILAARKSGMSKRNLLNAGSLAEVKKWLKTRK